MQGCDEGCAAYLFAAVLDAETGEELAGYGVNDTSALTAADGLRLPLLWRSGAGGEGGNNGTTVDTAPLAGRRVRLRLYFRDATVCVPLPLCTLGLHPRTAP